MASNTTNVALYMADPAVDGESTFNIQTMMNDNWVKLDNLFNGTTGHSHDGTAGNGPKILTSGLADGAVTTVKIADGAVTAAKVAADVATQAELDALYADLDSRILIQSTKVNANAPIDRYPLVGLSYMIVSDGNGYPGIYGVVCTQRILKDNLSISRDRQTFTLANSTIILERYPLATSKPAWAASTAYALNDLRMPTSANENGYYYKCTTAGNSGTAEPVWPTTIGATVTDGTAVWTCEGKFWSDWAETVTSVNGVIKTSSLLSFARTLSAGTVLIDLQQGYALYSDNVGLGTANNRLWLNTPDQGEVVIGPRAGDFWLNNVRLRASKVTIGTNSGDFLVWHDGPTSASARSSFHVYASADLAVAAATWTKVPFNTVIYDQLAEFQTSGNRFYALKTGIYNFKGTLSLGSGTAGASYHIRISHRANSGTLIKTISMVTGYLEAGGRVLPFSGDVRMAAGDYVEIEVNLSEARTLSATSGYTMCTGTRMA